MNAYELASKYNTEVANLKDNQLYKSRHGEELRAAAAAAINNPIVCTAAEFGEKYGHLFPKTHNWANVADHNPEDVFLWAFDAVGSHMTTARKNIYVIALYKVN